MNRPKELYFQYSSSKFQMMRDGVFKEYESYKVLENDEKLWLNELIEIEMNKLTLERPDSLFPLWYIIESNCLGQVYFQIIDWYVDNKDKYHISNQIRFKTEFRRLINNYLNSCKQDLELNNKLTDYLNIRISD